MIVIRELVNGVRDLLLRPDYARLTNSTVLLRIHDKLDYYRNLLAITNRNWLTASYRLDVDPNTTDYVLNADSWGRPFLAVTMDENDPNHIEREVELVTLQNRDLYYVGPKQGLTSFVAPHIAACISIYRKDDTNEFHALVTPQHTQAASYLLWYQPDRPIPPMLNDNYPLLESFTNLFKVDVAMSCIPNCVIQDDEGNVKNGAVIESITTALNNDFSKYGRLFDTFRNLAVMEQTGARRGFAEGSSEENLYW